MKKESANGMGMTRRSFLQVSSSVAAGFAARPGWARSRFGDREDFVLLDLGPQCALNESKDGYGRFLTDHPALMTRVLPTSCRFLIVPGVGRIDSGTACELSRLVRDGATLLFECACGFLSPDELASTRHVLENHFQLQLKPPIDLWADVMAGQGQTNVARKSAMRAPLNGRIPYIEYHWPHETMVRDFSRVVPVAEDPREIIARVGDLPVAMRRRWGKGSVIFLGSPLGPALAAGDVEAARWLHAVIKSA